PVSVQEKWELPANITAADAEPLKRQAAPETAAKKRVRMRKPPRFGTVPDAATTGSCIESSLRQNFFAARLRRSRPAKVVFHPSRLDRLSSNALPLAWGLQERGPRFRP